MEEEKPEESVAAVAVPKDSSDEEEEASIASKATEGETGEEGDDEEEEHVEALATPVGEAEPEEPGGDEEAEIAMPVFKKKPKKKIEVLDETQEEEIIQEVSLLDRHDSELTPQEIIEKDILMYELLMAEEELMEMEAEEKPVEVVEVVEEVEEEEEEEEEESVVEEAEEVEVVEEVVEAEPPPAELDADFMALFSQAAEDEGDELKTLFFGDLVSAEQEVDALVNIEGLVGISLSDKTKEFFDLEDMTDLPQKITWISFKKIKLHLYIYNELSEFFPFYEKIKYYPEASLLLGLDVTKQTKEDYYLCLSIEARNRVLNPPKRKRVAVDKKKKEEEIWNDMASVAPRKWRTLGSELDVAEENVYDSRPLLQVHVSRFRDNFGAACKFEDSPESINSYVAFEPEGPEKYPFVDRIEIDRAIQVMPQKTSQSTQTGFSFKRNKMTQHEIQSLPTEDVDKVMKSESMHKFFEKSLMNLLVNLQQNAMMDVTAADYQKMKATKGNESEFNNDALVLKEFQTYCDLRHSKGRCVTQMMFHPTLDEVIVMAVAEDATFDKRIEAHSKTLMEPNFVLFWDLKEVAHPQLMLDAPADVFSFEINPSDPHLVCGGCANGQIVLWDLGKAFTEFRNKIQDRRKTSIDINTRGSKPNFLEKLKDTAEKYSCPLIPVSGLSNLEQSHKRVVTAVAWVPPHVEVGKNGTLYENTMGGRSCQFFSIAGDGSLRLWDTRPPRFGVTDFGDEEKNPIKANPWAHLENNQWKFTTKYNLDDGNNGTMCGTLMTISEAKVGDLIAPVTEAGLQSKSAASDLAADSSSDNKHVKLGHKKRHSVANASTSGNLTDAPPPSEPPPLAKNVPGISAGGALTTIFMGTETGQICLTDWFRNKDGSINMDTGNKTCQNHYCQCYHDGAITSIARSPFFFQLILVVGGGTVSVWNEKASYPVLQSHGTNLFPWCGVWSNTRSAVFFCGTREGSVQVWDLLDRSNAPVFVQQVSPGRITDVSVPKTTTTKKHFLAVTDSEGVLYVLLIPRYYVKPLNLEQKTMKELMTREEKRMSEWIADRDGRLERLEAIHGSWKGHQKVKTNEESNQEEIEEEEKLQREYGEFLEFETKTAGKLKREEPVLPTVDVDVTSEFERLLQIAEEKGKNDDSRISFTKVESPPPSDHAF